MWNGAGVDHITTSLQPFCSTTDALKRSRLGLNQPHNILAFHACKAMASYLSFMDAVLRQIRVAQDCLDPTESEVVWPCAQRSSRHERTICANILQTRCFTVN
jgi:hypothetical protein